MAKTSDSLSHTKRMWKYHMVFSPKYRRKAIYYKVREVLFVIFVSDRGVEILEGYMMPDHVHMLVLMPSKLVSYDFIGYLNSMPI